MDPDAAIRVIIAAIDEDDWSQVAWSCEDLADWLDRGGFWPEKANLVALLRAMSERFEEEED